MAYMDSFLEDGFNPDNHPEWTWAQWRMDPEFLEMAGHTKESILAKLQEWHPQVEWHVSDLNDVERNNYQIAIEWRRKDEIHNNLEPEIRDGSERTTAPDSGGDLP